MPASSRAGPHEDPRQHQRRARAPQMRNDDKGCAARISPHTLLFAARSLVRKRKISQIETKIALGPDVGLVSRWSISFLAQASSKA